MSTEKTIQPAGRGEESEESTIDLLDLGKALLKKAWLLILCLIIGAGVGGVGTKLMVTPQYQATAMIYISRQSTSITTLADLQVGSALAVDFQVLSTTREVINEVIDRMDLSLSYGQLLSKIQVSNPADSHLLKVSVTDPNPKAAENIANCMADVLQGRIATVMNMDRPTLFSKADNTAVISSVSAKRNAILGGVLLMGLCAAVIIVLHLMDDTIKSSGDVRKYLKLNVLAEIPEDTNRKKRAS